MSDLKAQFTAAFKTSAALKSNALLLLSLWPIRARSKSPKGPKTKPKPKPVKHSKPADSDVELIAPSVKQKASQEDIADEPLAAEKPKRTRAKSCLRAKREGTKETADSAAEDNQDPVPKKKKRELNVGIFLSMQQPPVFQWDQGGIGLGISTELSPVKDALRRLHSSSSGPSFTKTRG
ncbi:hypothetical protein EDD22DRAFT_1031140, partial [Suillus occidentalis]